MPRKAINQFNRHPIVPSTLKNLTSFNKHKGFSLFEFVVVVILISILASIALNRMWSWRHESERMLIKTVTGNIRSALGLQTAQLALDNKLNLLPTLAGSNPFSLLAQKPTNYLGELSEDDEASRQPGNWYFSKEQQAIVYILKHPENFQTSLDGIPRVRLKIKFIYADKNLNRRYDPGVDDIAGLDFVALDTFNWNK